MDYVNGDYNSNYAAIGQPYYGSDGPGLDTSGLQQPASASYGLSVNGNLSAPVIALAAIIVVVLVCYHLPAGAKA